MKLEIYAQALNNSQKKKNVREFSTLLSYNDGRHCDQLWQDYRGTTVNELLLHKRKDEYSRKFDTSVMLSVKDTLERSPRHGTRFASPT
jgi:hypothetical protein